MAQTDFGYKLDGVPQAPMSLNITASERKGRKVREVAREKIAKQLNVKEDQITDVQPVGED